MHTHRRPLTCQHAARRRRPELRVVRQQQHLAAAASDARAGRGPFRLLLLRQVRVVLAVRTVGQGAALHRHHLPQQPPPPPRPAAASAAALVARRSPALYAVLPSRGSGVMPLGTALTHRNVPGCAT